MPLSGTFRVRYLLSLQQQFKVIIVGTVSSFVSIGEDGQSSLFQIICELDKPHIIG